MYVLGGRDVNNYISSIEKLTNIAGPVPNDLSQWQLIEPINSFEPRQQSVFCALNDRELVILGGNNDETLSDAWILDSKDDTMRQVIQPTANSLQFYSEHNQSTMTN